LFWLPDGKRLSFLVMEPNARFSLMLAELREGAPIRIVATGAPLFFDWGRKAGEILIHLNSRRAGLVSLVSLTPTSQDVERELARGDAPFKTPCWSPDGAHLAFVASDDDDVARLYVADSDGKNAKAMVKLLPGQSSFVWARDSRHIAFSTAQLPPYDAMDGISLLDITDSSVKKLVNDDVAAYYFSPDSRWIAYVAVPAKETVYTWNLVDVRSAKRRKLVSLLATNEETIAWRYFEQLSLSHSVWAPDSSAIAFAGALVKKEQRGNVPNRPMAAPAPNVMIMPIDASEPRTVARGVVAFWAPLSAK